MPQQRVIVRVQKSPPEEFELGVFEETKAKDIKSKLDKKKDFKIVSARLEPVSGT